MFNENFLLSNNTAIRLYNEYAKDLPIIDYHCHLLPKDIYENKVFENLGEMWLKGDHYKWRAMRTFGINEKFITGNKSYYEKFIEFSKIFPKLIGNPLYIWCQTELKRIFKIDEPLSFDNANEIYNKTLTIIREKKINPKYLMDSFNVVFVCTTDNPIDNLIYHEKIKNENIYKTKIVPAFRPDECFYIEKDNFLNYIYKLSDISMIDIKTSKELIEALEKRIIFFKTLDAVVSDLSIEEIDFVFKNDSEIDIIFSKKLNNAYITKEEEFAYKTWFIIKFGKLCKKYDLVYQLHIGTYKGANEHYEKLIGEATGFDCSNDFGATKPIGKILNELTKQNNLPKTILYPLNINLYESFAILAAGFCFGETKALVQVGAPWWFNDQIYGINKQFESVSNLYPISLSIGMLTDSRSFLSYSRYEIYRRILCNYFGKLIERGEYFASECYIKNIIESVCFFNAKEYFYIN